MRLRPPPDHSHEPEHPVVAWVGLIAIALAVLLIVWVRFEVRGTAEVKSVFSAEPVESQQASRSAAKTDEEGGKRGAAESAAVKSRWATGFSQ